MVKYNSIAVSGQYIHFAILLPRPIDYKHDWLRPSPTSHRLASCVIVSGFRAALDLELS